jgi:hypothetical protein
MRRTSTGVSRSALQRAGGVSDNGGIGGNVACHYSASTNQSSFANADTAHDRGIGADRGTVLNDGFLKGPLVDDWSTIVHGPRVPVVDERNTVADEHIVTDSYALADKRVRRYFTTPPNARVLLNFDERSDFRVVADRAFIEVYETKVADILADCSIAYDDIALDLGNPLDDLHL